MRLCPWHLLLRLLQFLGQIMHSLNYFHFLLHQPYFHHHTIFPSHYLSLFFSLSVSLSLSLSLSLSIYLFVFCFLFFNRLVYFALNHIVSLWRAKSLTVFSIKQVKSSKIILYFSHITTLYLLHSTPFLLNVIILI